MKPTSSRVVFWTVWALVAYPTIRILLHVVEAGFGIYGSRTLNTLISHYVFAVIINAIPALFLKSSGLKGNLLRYALPIAVVLGVATAVRLISVRGAANFEGVARFGTLDVLNYTLPALLVAYLATVVRLPSRSGN